VNDQAPDSQVRARARGAVRASKTWGGYGWFMSFGTFLPLPVLLLGYLVNVTLVGEPLARQIYRFALFIPTLGQTPPGADRVKAKMDQGGRKPLGERIRPYSPPGWIERHGKPVSMPLRIGWFVLVGWWFGGIWVVIAWSVLLLPYPLLDMIWSLLDDLPSVMTLAWPKPRPAAQSAGVSAGVAPVTE
jgi:hypothetical protein